jgi:ribosomal protein L17
MEIIIAALVAGATAAAKDTAGQAVTSAYKGLKDLIKNRFVEQGKKEDSNIVDDHEKKLESEAFKALLKEEFAKVGVDKDAEIQKIAEELMELLKSEQSGSASSSTTNIQAKNVVSQIGDKNIQKDITFN